MNYLIVFLNIYFVLFTSQVNLVCLLFFSKTKQNKTTQLFPTEQAMFISPSLQYFTEIHIVYSASVNILVHINPFDLCFAGIDVIIRPVI